MPGISGDTHEPATAGTSDERYDYRQNPAITTPPTVPLIAPLNDTRRSDAGLAVRGGRRAPGPGPPAAADQARGRAGIAGRVGGSVAVLDAFHRVPFPAYLWVGLGILGAGLLISLMARRMMLSLLIPIAVLAVAAFALGGTRASLRDGSGQIGWMPTSLSQLTDHRQFAGQTTLDLTALPKLDSARSLTITQAAGEVVLRIPAGLNATVISDVHLGDMRNGESHAIGQYVSGLNVHLELPPASGSTGAPLTIHVQLTNGHVQVDRTS